MTRIAPTTLVLALALAPGCGERDPAPLFGELGIQLLARAPDQVIEQVGRLTPDAEDDWARLAGVGWSDAGRAEGTSGPVAWALQPEVRVELPCLAPTDRALRIELAALAGDDVLEVDVRLNGRAVGSLELDAGVSEHALDVPAVAWLRGANVLTLLASEMRSAPEGERRGVGVVALEWGEPVRGSSSTSDARAELSSGTALVYDLELIAESELSVEGRGSGELEVRFAPRSARTGESAIDEAVPLVVRSDAGGVAARLPIPRLGDDVVRVELLWRGATPADGLELSSLRLEERDAPPRTPVVFISIDTLSARHTSLDGYVRDTTPNLAALAREAVVFTNARSNAPFTIPSYMSQLTGLYPEANRIEAPRSTGRYPHPWETKRIASNRWTLPESLRAAGWRTMAIVDNPWLAAPLGYRQGFDRYDTAPAEKEIWEVGGGIELVVERARALLSEVGDDEPVFLFAQALDPHGPYLPDEPWRGTFTGDAHDRERLLRVGRDQLHAYGVIPEYIALGVAHADELPDEMDAGPLIASYDEKVLQTDHWLGELFDLLRERGLYDRSLVIVSADHGESMLEHEFYFNHGTLYDEALHVPLLVKLPGGEFGGREIGLPVQLVDLYPTIAELCGLPVRDFLHGRSLVPLLRGGVLPEVPLFAEAGIADGASVVVDGWKLLEDSGVGGSMQTMLTHPRRDREQLAELHPELVDALWTNQEIGAYFEGRWDEKRAFADVVRGPFLELYRVETDRGELEDRAADEPLEVERLTGMLERLRQRGRSAREDALHDAPPVAFSEEALRELAALGYTDDDE